MKHSKLLLIVAGTLALPAVLSFAAPAPRAASGNACDEAADAVLNGARHEARADFWIQVARCINDPDGPLAACVQEAMDARDEALELAEQQHRARLKLCAMLGPGRYDPPIQPGAFSSSVTNPWMPLVPGRTLVYEKTTPKGLERVAVTTLARTVEIEGVECRAVRDLETLNGAVVEDTEDWFAQHGNGAVWYFGELALNYDEQGFLEDIGGSWRAGKDGAKPGILMLAAPAPGDLYRQEYFLNEAEDVAQVLSVSETVVVPYGTFTNCLQTLEWSPLEPEDYETKYYASGIGLVLEVDIATGERLELVQIR